MRPVTSPSARPRHLPSRRAIQGDTANRVTVDAAADYTGPDSPRFAMHTGLIAKPARFP